MIVERPGAARGHVAAGWLDSRHTFSFGQYHDPAWMGFGALRVLNEDRVAPGAGFPTHGHANMEILSYVLDGALAHRDDAGGEGGVLVPGELQWMGAGHGIRHSEFNGSDTEPVHFLQVWIQPDRVNAPPGWASRAFPVAARQGRWAELASPDGAGGGLPMRQQAWVRGTLLLRSAMVSSASSGLPSNQDFASVCGNSTGDFSKKSRSYATIAVQGAAIVLARLPSLSAGSRRRLASAERTKTKRAGQVLAVVGPHFSRSYSRWRVSSSTSPENAL